MDSKPKCCFTTAKGTQCPFAGKNEYDTHFYCQKHLRIVRSTEDCPICFMPMLSKKTKIRLTCGHYFHIGCLSQCNKAECPICRSQLAANIAYKVYKVNVVKPIIGDIFSMAKELHGYAFSCIRSICSIVSKGAFHASLILEVVTQFDKFSHQPSVVEDAALLFIQMLTASNTQPES